MERNDSFDSGYGESGSGSSSFGEGTKGSSNGGYSAGSVDATTSNVESDVTSKVQQAKDTAADTLGTVKSRAADLKDKAADLGSKATEKASELKATLADKLDSGAEALRHRTQGNALATTDGSAPAVAVDDKMAQFNSALASGMESTAKFLREGDLKAAVEEQVKNHPARTLLVALGAGYLLGKAIRK